MTAQLRPVPKKSGQKKKKKLIPDPKTALFLSHMQICKSNFLTKAVISFSFN